MVPLLGDLLASISILVPTLLGLTKPIQAVREEFFWAAMTQLLGDKKQALPSAATDFKKE